MIIQHPARQSQCPFWSLQTMKCTVYSGGLFIPLDNHKEIFCTTYNYFECLQYNLNRPDKIHGIPTAKKLDSSRMNRRRHARFEDVHTVTLVEIISTKAITTHLATITTTATTIDVSMRGMRLLSNAPLTDNTTLEFSFDDSFPETSRSARGQVEWCNKQIDVDGYQAGISFSEQQIVEAMALHLKRQNN